MESLLLLLRIGFYVNNNNKCAILGRIGQLLHQSIGGGEKNTNVCYYEDKKFHFLLSPCLDNHFCNLISLVIIIKLFAIK